MSSYQACHRWLTSPVASPLSLKPEEAAPPYLAVMTLIIFLGVQLVPGLSTLSAAQAQERQREERAELRRKAQARPPLWYVQAKARQARQKKTMAQRSAQLKAQQLKAAQRTMRLAQNEPANDATQDENAPDEMAPEGVATDEPGQDEVSQVDGARGDDLQGNVDSSKPGQVKASEPGGCTDCAVDMKALDLSRPPTEKELRKAGQLGGALSPNASADVEKLTQALSEQNLPTEEKTARIKRLQDINWSFGEAIQEWNKHNFKTAAKMFGQHVKDYPDSPWSGEAKLHLGCDAKYNGRFSEAEATYDNILQSTSDDPADLSFDVHQKAKARWADLDLARGQLDDAAAKFRDIIKTDDDWRRITWAQSWLQTTGIYKANFRSLLTCGPQALSVVLASLGKKEAAAKVARLKPAGSTGFSLAQLEQLAKQYGVPMRGFKAKPQQLAALPLPLIVHYDYNGVRQAGTAKLQTGRAKLYTSKRHAKGDGKGRVAQSLYHPVRRVGHYLVVQRVNAKQNQVQLYDPQERRLYNLSYQQFAHEWSGVGLVLAKAGHAKKRLASRELLSSEMNGISGGCCGTYSAPPGTGCSCGNQTGNGSSGCPCAGGGGNNRAASGFGSGSTGSAGPYGSPIWSINRTSLNLFIKDIPLWYTPPVGPPVEVTMSYNSQDSLTQNNSFGNKWMFNYGSYAVEDTAAGGGRVTVFMPDGSQDNYTPNGSGGYVAPIGVFNTLRKLGPTNYELEFPGGDKALYAIPAGTTSLQPFMVELRDRFGYSLFFGYNSNVKLTTITDAQGKVTKLDYDAQGHIVRVTDPAERAASFSYDAAGNMIEAVDMEGQAFQYTYNSSKYVTKLNTAQGAWDFNHYFSYGDNSVSISDPLGKSETFYYSNWGAGTFRYTDKRNNTTRYTVGNVIGGEGKITEMRYPDGTVTSTSYDGATGLVSSETDARSKTTYYTYNAQGRVTSIKKPKGGITSYYYAPNGIDLTSVTNADSQTVSTIGYNSKHLPLQVTNALTQPVDVTYTPWGKLATITENGTRVTTLNYDPTTKHLMSVSRGSAVLESYTYDNIGRVRTRTDAAGLTVTIDYNNLDQITRVTYPDGTHADTEYVCCGLPGMTSDRSGRRSYRDYDPLKRLLRTQDAQAGSISYEYDPNGNRIRMLDSKGNGTTWRYDSVNRPLAKTYMDSTAELNTYSGGLLASRRNARGQLTQYNYDDNGNLTLVDYSTMPDISFTWDSLDRVTQMTDELGLTIYGRDALNRITSIDGPFANDTVTYTFDSLGRRSTLRISGVGGADYGHDALDRLISVTSAAGGFGYSYFGNTDMVQTLTMPNGTYTSYSYDALERLTSVTNSRQDNSLISSYAYGHNTRDVRTWRESQVGTAPLQHIDYAYDDLDQLTSEVSTGTSPPVNQGYAYDAMGNRTGAQSNGTQTGVYQTSYTSNRLNQLTSYTTTQSGTTTTTTPTYDLSGNVTNVPIGQGGLTYSYDEANRLVQIVQRDSSGVYTKKSDFLYDGLNRKVISREYSWINGAWTPQSEVRRVYDRLQVVQERDANNAVTTNYTRGADLSGGLKDAGGIGGLLSKTTASAHLYYHYDGHGNVVQLTSATAQGTAAEYTYDAYGRALTASGAQATANTYRYSTKEVHLVSGLVDYGYRFYSPSHGRWLNRDPIAEEGGLNLYGFVDNSPSNRYDIDGRIAPWLVMCLVRGAASAVGTAVVEYYKWSMNCNGFDWAPIITSAILGCIGGAWAGRGGYPSKWMEKIVKDTIMSVLKGVGIGYGWDLMTGKCGTATPWNGPLDAWGDPRNGFRIF
ncbi:MAG TPA: RHS repeat-associated core domain-containing protein [Abditibacteriaceae bacterium]